MNIQTSGLFGAKFSQWCHLKICVLKYEQVEFNRYGIPQIALLFTQRKEIVWICPLTKNRGTRNCACFYRHEIDTLQMIKSLK